MESIFCCRSVSSSPSLTSPCGLKRPLATTAHLPTTFQRFRHIWHLALDSAQPAKLASNITRWGILMALLRWAYLICRRLPERKIRGTWARGIHELCSGGQSRSIVQLRHERPEVYTEDHAQRNDGGEASDHNGENAVEIAAVASTLLFDGIHRLASDGHCG